VKGQVAALWPVEPYTASVFSRLEQLSGGTRQVPASLAHAKFLGESTTVCGELCGTWTKRCVELLWDSTQPRRPE
jgi:hypothetical protein